MTKIDYFTEERSIETVNARMGEDLNPRLCEVMASLIKHLHGFVKDVELTQDEWESAIDFLTRTGQLCDDKRQEFILLSDTLGVSMLVDAIQHRRPEAATENTVFGPFHVDGAPVLKMGANISLDGKGESCLYQGRVLDLEGNPIAGVRIDVWSDNSEGFYDVQQPNQQPTWNNRGVFITGTDGRYQFMGIKPVAYPIPDDGPVGQMLGNLGRHPWRPAHMHFMLNHPNFERIVTHTFVAGDPYLTSDTVFGVKESLILDYFACQEGKAKWQATFDFIMVNNG
ncbi:MAG: dioxygenase [Pseudomonas sp.]|nr:dioxygenase [Pseudomonas sp.]